MGKRAGLFVILVTGVLFASTVQADSLLSGKEAQALLGPLESYFSEGPYSVLVLDRRERQPIHLDPIDAILFNPGGGSFKKTRTRDRDHRLILNSPTGRPGEPLTPELLKRLLNLIQSNHLVPYVLKDPEGKERLVVFADPYNTCSAHQTSKGILVSIEAHPFRRQKTLAENPIWFRKY